MKYCLFFLFGFISLVATAQDYKLEGNEVKIEKQIVFETNAAILQPESTAALEIIKKYLDDKSYISLLRIECHTDNSGDNDANQTLSEKRALAVCKALVKMGVDCKRLIAVGFGSTKPVEDNATPAGKAANRRVSFINAALRNHPIGGMPVDGGGKVAGDTCN
ncbi:OmpA family protein [Ferruginibacter sp. SUN106]|uniref:OmpA family protein n=1 Tax=Ferruginibacter sp. SUN106 TaxID=2978348 RepID=UPI003D36335C